MFTPRDHNEGRSHNIKTDNSSFAWVGQFEYLGSKLTNQNSTQEEIKSRLKSENISYYSVQNLLPSTLLSKNIKIEIYRTIIVPVVLYECETWLLILRWECRLRFLRIRLKLPIPGSTPGTGFPDMYGLYLKPIYIFYKGSNRQATSVLLNRQIPALGPPLSNSCCRCVA
jgi:hypothetical protein